MREPLGQGPLVAFAAPRRPLRHARRRFGQLGRRLPGGKHRVAVPHTAGIRAGDLGQPGRPPARAQRGADGRGEPVPLGRGQPPRAAEGAEELIHPAAAGQLTIAWRHITRASRGGRRFTGRFLVRFGCNRCTPWLQAGPGVQRLHPVQLVVVYAARETAPIHPAPLRYAGRCRAPG
jgi:hypothetical protein